MSFYKRLDTKFDIPKLIGDLQQYIFPLGEPFFQGAEYGHREAFGGWTLQSHTGHWLDGWELGHVVQGEAKEVFYPNGKTNYKAFKFMNLAQPVEHNIRTEACKGEFAKVLDTIESMGLNPRRARVTLLNPGTESSWHSDGTEDSYLVRLHIPLITDEKCIHTCLDERIHMPADGSSYIMWVNKFHKAENYSDIKRYHILMDVYDTDNVVGGFNYTGDFNEELAVASEYRRNINNTVLTDEDMRMFTEIQKKFIQDYHGSK
jgi:hypothetical protein